MIHNISFPGCNIFILFREPFETHVFNFVELQFITIYYFMNDVFRYSVVPQTSVDKTTRLALNQLSTFIKIQLSINTGLFLDSQFSSGDPYAFSAPGPHWLNYVTEFFCEL